MYISIFAGSMTYFVLYLKVILRNEGSFFAFVGMRKNDDNV